jgi:hypothetical protein
MIPAQNSLPPPFRLPSRMNGDVDTRESAGLPPIRQVRLTSGKAISAVVCRIIHVVGHTQNTARREVTAVPNRARRASSCRRASPVHAPDADGSHHGPPPITHPTLAWGMCFGDYRFCQVRVGGATDPKAVIRARRTAASTSAKEWVRRTRHTAARSYRQNGVQFVVRQRCHYGSIMASRSLCASANAVLYCTPRSRLKASMLLPFSWLQNVAIAIR